jgi:hypothetical protein
MNVADAEPGHAGWKSLHRNTSGPPYWWYWMRVIVVMVNTPRADVI